MPEVRIEETNVNTKQRKKEQKYKAMTKTKGSDKSGQDKEYKVSTKFLNFLCRSFL